MKLFKLPLILMILLCVTLSPTISAATQTPLPTQYSKNTLVKVNDCDIKGTRKANAKVDIGVGSRQYYAYTNKYGQLAYIHANDIILQNPKTEKLTSQGRYCNDEAKVPGTEKSNLDEGHGIADSLGASSNAFNITPQDSTLNRSGQQATMEEYIRKAEKSGRQITDFNYTITYPDTKTQIPSSYKVTFKDNGVTKTYNYKNSTSVPTTTKPTSTVKYKNCTEVKAAGKSPLKKGSPGYSTSLDRDGDGVACEK